MSEKLLGTSQGKKEGIKCAGKVNLGINEFDTELIELSEPSRLWSFITEDGSKIGNPERKIR